jgi:hypothetical protein
MKEISISGIKLLLDMDIDYSSFTGDLKQLTDAAGDLDGGAGDLLDGSQAAVGGHEGLP